MKQSKLKYIITEAVLQTLIEESGHLYEEDHKYSYENGIKWGRKYKMEGKTLEQLLENFPNLPRDFIKGFKTGYGDSTWMKFNDKLTNWLAQLGSSRLRQ